MILSLKFTTPGSKTMIITWQNGVITQHYNGHKPYRVPMAQPPFSVAAFEAFCRQRFQLGLKWNSIILMGEKAA